MSEKSRPVVLVVEDEPIVRLNTVTMVEDEGFDAIAVSTADEAIEILEKRNDIHIVFTDIRMPGSMDGLALAQAVRNRWPPVRIVVTSGNMLGVADKLVEGSRFVPKPHDRHKVAQVLHELSR